MDSSTHQSPKEDEDVSPPEIPPETQLEKSPCEAIVEVDLNSPLRSPQNEKKPFSPENPPFTAVVRSASPVIVVNRSIREELETVTKMGTGEDGFAGNGRRYEGSMGDRRPKSVSSILRTARRKEMVKKGVALGLRFSSLVFCLVSFSIIAADTTQGWAGDSFYRYKELRYCMAMNVIGFLYAAFQACDLASSLIAGKQLFRHHLRCYFDFSMDQIMTYFLISASSSAATRIDDWQSNWGKDKFTVMASASIGISFLAFATFAFSSLISGYNLSTRIYT